LQIGRHEPLLKVPLKFIEVEYKQDLKPLEKVLSGVKRPGDFFASGVLEMPMPQIDVEGVGTLSFPIPDDSDRDTRTACGTRSVWQRRICSMAC
jgi:hypothetical protein